ncbi:DUF6233 domain-containing protein [Streptomyces chartreusis]|uniref:DUF6233 domain-containing protein n=1 Tax=Streptomyces chartreusis TaxID=1969 RepID=UPI0036D027D8
MVITLTSHASHYRTENRTREGGKPDHGHRIKNVFDGLPPDLERLNTLRVWHALRVERIDRKIAAVQRRQAEEERGRRNRPERPDWIVELGIGADRAPVQVHAGDCYIAGKRRRAVSRDEARRLLTAGLEACTHCEPDTQLNIIDLSRPRSAGPSRPARKIEQSCHSERILRPR